MKLEVFDKYTRLRIDIIKVYDYLTYEDAMDDRGDFEITIPTKELSLDSIQKGNYIWFENGIVGIISFIGDKEDEQTEVSVKGYLLNNLLTYRSFLSTTMYYDKINIIARQMITDLFIDPEDQKRQIDFITLSDDEKYNPTFTDKIRVQNTGDNLLEYLQQMFATYELGFELYPIFENYSELNENQANFSVAEFRILKPVDRTIGNTDQNVPVVFSFDFGNLSMMNYEEDDRDYKNIAIVAGEGVGSERKIVEVGDTVSTGLDRIELYVDARDIQSDSDPEEPLTDEELEELMTQRGNEKLKDHQQFISFEATILEGKYKYGVDFYKADYVSVIDKNTRRIYDVQIYSVKKTISNGVQYIDITFGRDRFKIREFKERRLYNV